MATQTATAILPQTQEPSGFTIPTYLVGDDLVILIGETVLVTSKSQPGAWRPVENETCTCVSFEYRGCCRHVEAARSAAEMDRKNAQPVTASRWLVDHYLAAERDELARYDATGEWPAIWGRRS